MTAKPSKRSSSRSSSSSEIAELLGANVKKFRKSLGLTQQALARKTDLSVVFIQNIESGRRWVGPETVTLLARALGLRETELFSDPNHPAPRLDPRDILAAISHALGVDTMILSPIQRRDPVRSSRPIQLFPMPQVPQDICLDIAALSDHPEWHWDSLRVALKGFRQAAERGDLRN